MAGGVVIGAFPCCGRWRSAAWDPCPGRYAGLWAIRVKLTDWRGGIGSRPGRKPCGRLGGDCWCHRVGPGCCGRRRRSGWEEPVQASAGLADEGAGAVAPRGGHAAGALLPQATDGIENAGPDLQRADQTQAEAAVLRGVANRTGPSRVASTVSPRKSHAPPTRSVAPKATRWRNKGLAAGSTQSSSAAARASVGPAARSSQRRQTMRPLIRGPRSSSQKLKPLRSDQASIMPRWCRWSKGRCSVSGSPPSVARWVHAGLGASAP